MILHCDTNALVALVVDDRAEQRAAVLVELERARAGHGSVVVSESVLVEAIWVLTTRYGLAQSEAASRLASILAANGLEAFDTELVNTALGLASSKPALSIVDCLLVLRSWKLGDAVLTFDERLAREVEQPGPGADAV